MEGLMLVPLTVLLFSLILAAVAALRLPDERQVQPERQHTDRLRLPLQRRRR
jgi:hypothetical protein